MIIKEEEECFRPVLISGGLRGQRALEFGCKIAEKMEKNGSCQICDVGPHGSSFNSFGPSVTILEID